MIPYLDCSTSFPSVSSALDEPNGLLAAGADLSIERLIKAYSSGIFPWYSEGEPILWWSPNPRTIFDLSQFQPSRSLKRFIRKSKLKITLNRDFDAVLNQCAMPRTFQAETWISDEMKLAYIKLHQQKFAHSVEVWQNEQLVGGIYGVSIGKLFCGESMFSRISNGSKVALTYLIEYLKTEQFPIIDCQVENAHLVSLGSINLERDKYIQIVNNTKDKTLPSDFWEEKQLADIECSDIDELGNNK